MGKTSLESRRKWNEENREHVKAYRRAYYLAHKEKELQQRKEWGAQNPKQNDKHRRRWKRRNKSKMLAYKRESMARRRDREALAAAAEAKKQPARALPKVSALLKLAEAKASQAQYGIRRIGYQEAR